jgi:DNA helicase II / ATP-dependent DNA helicase PcrA
MVVGNDAQAIYSFRAATVRNILEFPERFEPRARIVTLEQNYRSTQPILDACNAVMSFVFFLRRSPFQEPQIPRGSARQ